LMSLSAAGYLSSPKNNPMQIEAVIFDMDGLMFDTERIAQRAWERTFNKLGTDLTPEMYRKFIGLTVSDLEKFIYHTFGDEFPFEKAYRIKQKYTQESIQKLGIPLKSGLLEIIDLMDSIPKRNQRDTNRMDNASKEFHLLKGVVSCSMGDIVRSYLLNAGFQFETFDVIVSGDEVEFGKPSPDIFLLASERLKVSPRRCLVMEDSNAGIKVAHAAGMIPVMIPDLIPPDDESRVLAYRILPDLIAAAELIKMCF